MKQLIAALFSLLLVACSGLSDEEKDFYSSACQEFVEENAPGRSGSGGFDTTVFDIYKKKENWVVEVGYKRRFPYSETYSVRLCVVDVENGRLHLPNPMNASEWRK